MDENFSQKNDATTRRISQSRPNLRKVERDIGIQAKCRANIEKSRKSALVLVRGGTSINQHGYATERKAPTGKKTSHTLRIAESVRIPRQLFQNFHTKVVLLGMNDF